MTGATAPGRDNSVTFRQRRGSLSLIDESLRVGGTMRARIAAAAVAVALLAAGVPATAHAATGAGTGTGVGADVMADDLFFPDGSSTPVDGTSNVPEKQQGGGGSVQNDDAGAGDSTTDGSSRQLDLARGSRANDLMGDRKSTRLNSSH